MQLLDIITKGATDVGLTLRMADSGDGTPETGVTSATSGLDVWYRRQGAAKVSLTESDLSALTDAHSDGGLLHIADGTYRVDFPDAAFAAGVEWVDVGWNATGMVGFGGRVRLISATRGLSGTALPDAAADAAGGLPISDAGGLDLDNLRVRANILHTGTAQAGASGTITLDSGASSVDNYYRHTIIRIVSGTGVGQSRLITSYVGSTRVATIESGHAWAITPDNTSVFDIIASSSVDLQSWAGQAVQLHTFGGYTLPFVYGNLAMIRDVAQSAIDLKDLVDTGYDPATHKIQGVAQVDVLTTYTGNTPQSGDSYSIVSHGTYGNAAINDDLDSLLSRISAARAAYLDNLNVGGAVASQADVTALNQSASRRLVLTTVQQYERPESSSTNFQIELRTYDGDGAAVNADSTPTLTATGITSGDLSANLSASSNPATGVYRWTYNVESGDTLEQIRFDVSATMTSAFTLACYAQVVDTVAVNWSSSDAAKLTAVYDKLPSKAYIAGTSNSDGDIQINEVTGSLAWNSAWDAEIESEVTDGLNAYDPPTNAEMVARTLAAADYATASALTTVASNVTTLLSRITSTLFAGITSLAEWLGLIAGKQTGNSTARTELRATGAGSGTFLETTDSIEAIRDRGDAAWTGGGGGDGDEIILGPLVSTYDPANRVGAGASLEIFNGSKKTFGLVVLDADDLPVDLSGRTLRFVVHTNEASPTVLIQVEDADIDISGADMNVASVLVSAANAAQTPGEYSWKLWDVSTADEFFVLIHGEFIVLTATSGE